MHVVKTYYETRSAKVFLFKIDWHHQSCVCVIDNSDEKKVALSSLFIIRSQTLVALLCRKCSRDVLVDVRKVAPQLFNSSARH